MRVLGIDPGTQCTGWGIVDRKGNRLVGVDAGTIRSSSSMALERRLRRVYDGLQEVVAKHEPEIVAVESIFHAKYANAAIKLGHVRGVALLVAAHASLEVHDYPPSLVKRTVAGRGAADKTQVALLVGTILGWKTLPAVDATDALAVAITHAQALRMQPAAPPRRRGAVPRNR